MYDFYKPDWYFSREIETIDLTHLRIIVIKLPESHIAQSTDSSDGNTEKNSNEGEGADLFAQP